MEYLRKKKELEVRKNIGTEEIKIPKALQDTGMLKNEDEPKMMMSSGVHSLGTLEQFIDLKFVAAALHLPILNVHK